MAEYQLSKEEQKKLNDAVDEMVNSLIRQDAEVQLRKDIAERVKEELGFKSSELNALARERFDNKATEQVEKFQDVIDLNSLLLANAGD